jgi:BMFP domain-containing protein YqiC
METPAEKQRRIDRTIAPLIERIHAIELHDDVHIAKSGHREMMMRMQAVERRMNSIDAVEREETEVLREMMETQKEQTKIMRDTAKALQAEFTKAYE